MKPKLRAFGQEISGNRGRNDELSNTQRAAIYSAWLTGTSVKELAASFRCHRNTITKTVQRFKTHQTFTSLPRSGAPTKINPQQKRFIRRIVKRFPWLSWRELIAQSPVAVHPNTIRAALGKDYRRKWRAITRIILTKEIAALRLAFTRYWRQKEAELLKVWRFKVYVFFELRLTLNLGIIL